MHLPIFSADSKFLQPSPDGRKVVFGRQESELIEDFVQVQMLRSEMNVVKVKTDIGIDVEITAETLFALHIDGDQVLLYNPALPQYAGVPELDWKAKWGGEDDLRRWFIIGAVLSGGNFSAETNRPARMIIPTKLAPPIVDYLRRVSINPAFRFTTLPNVKSMYAVNVLDLDDTTVITSRLIDKMIGSFLVPLSKMPMFEPSMLSIEQRHAFFSGVLAGMEWKDDRLVFRNRSAAVVRRMHDIFMEVGSLFSVLSINPMEPEVQKSTRVTYPHHCYLDEDALDTALQLGFIHGSKPKGLTVTGYRYAKIIDATPIGPKPVCTVIAPHDFGVVVNWFVVRSNFVIPDAAEIASMPAFVNPARFEEVFE